MSPVVDGLAQDYGDRALFRRLNAQQEGEQLFRQYRLRGHPAYVILDQRGQVAWQKIGEVSRQELEDALRQVLQ
jgi:biopolymer transport protein ExbD